MIVQVYVDSAVLSLDKEFHYGVPEKYRPSIKVGMRVKVPFGPGNRHMQAYVTDVLEDSTLEQLKDIIAPIDDEPILSPEAVEISKYICESCFCSRVAAIKLFLPPGLGMKFYEYICLGAEADTPLGEEYIHKSAKRARVIQIIRDNGGIAEMQQLKGEMGSGVGAVVSALVKKHILEKTFKEKQRASEKTVKVVYYSSDEDPYELSRALAIKAPVQSAVIKLLANGEEYSVSDLEEVISSARSAVDALCEKGFASCREVEALRRPLSDDKKAQSAKAAKLSAEQEAAVDCIKNAPQRVVLLHGVTGSGKTEVYMEAAAEVMNQGKQVIVLVPEIALTSQITDRFYRRFGDSVAVIHSALSMGERMDEWRRIKRGDAKIIVGARSAVFAPCEKLGLIIVDEEHESSYKSESTPRYHAKNIALLRGKINNCKVVLASATPSVQSYYLAKAGSYALAKMKERHNKKALPKVEIVDMRQELMEGNSSVLSRALATELHKNLKDGRQSILLLNRRGYSTFVSCRSCGYVYTCPNCSVTMTYHLKGNSLVCHMCGHTEPAPTHCPECGSDKIRDFGKGTQKAEAQICEIFPEARVLRMDMDSTAGKRGHEKIIDSFAEGEGDILLGTQMVAKGLDFQKVTLVGVLAADSALNMSDFRASERAFNLITQVCGRAGRGEEEGRAVIQTYMPESNVLRLAAKQDYEAFYNEEICYRKSFVYPPFCKIVNIIFSSMERENACSAAKSAAAYLKEYIAMRGIKAQVYGGGEAPVAKIQNKYRFRVWLKTTDIKELTPALKHLTKEQRFGKDLSVVVDVNPNSMN